VAKPNQSPSIQEGWYLYWQCNFYLIKELEPDGKLFLENADNPADTRDATIHEILVVDSGNDIDGLCAPTLEALHALIEADAPRPEPLASDEIPQNLLDSADRTICIVETVEAYVEEIKRQTRLAGKPEDFSRTKAILQSLSKLEPELRVKKTQFYKHREVYDKYNGDRVKIAASLRRATYGKTQMSLRTLHLVDEMILREYVRSKATRKMTVYRKMEDVLQRTGGLWIDPEKCVGGIPANLIEELLNTRIPIEIILNNSEKSELLSPTDLPSKSWFSTYVKWFENHPERSKSVITARYGSDHWENNYQIFDTFVHRAQYPLHYVFADHHLLDIFTVDEDDRSKTYRLWLTVLIDAYSRAILGFVVLNEDPCIESIQQALQHAIWPKNPKEDIDSDLPWIAYGIPQVLSLDNAWAHLSHSLEALAREIGQNNRYDTINLLFRPPYKARYGALVERFFGSFTAILREEFPDAGAILSSDRADVAKAKKTAVLLAEDIERFIYRSIVEYMHKPHRELDLMTPSEKWREGMNGSLPVIPRLTEGMRRHFMRLWHETRTINTKGISLFGMHYHSPDLSMLTKVDMTGQKVRYSIRYDPNDIHQISLFRDGEYFCDAFAKELRMADESYRSLSIAERDLCKEVAKSKGRESRRWLDEIDGFANSQENRELAKMRKSEKRLSTRNNKQKETSTEFNISEAEKRLSQEKGNDDHTDLLLGFIE